MPGHQQMPGGKRADGVRGDVGIPQRSKKNPLGQGLRPGTAADQDGEGRRSLGKVIRDPGGEFQGNITAHGLPQRLLPPAVQDLHRGDGKPGDLLFRRPDTGQLRHRASVAQTPVQLAGHVCSSINYHFFSPFRFSPCKNINILW